MKKTYGSYQVNQCIFCGTAAYSVNPQGIPVCNNHKSAEVDMDAIRCACGDYLDIKEGKFGAFFLCMKCGPRSIAKVKEINTITIRGAPKPPIDRFKQNSNSLSSNSSQSNSSSSSSSSSGSSGSSKTPYDPTKELVITTDDVDYFD